MQFSDAHQLKGAYRFLADRRIRAASVFQALADSTALRCAEHAKVLLIADGCSLSLDRQAVAGLGVIGDGRAKGLLFHTVLAVDAATHEVLGPAAQDRWIRRTIKHSQGQRSRDRRDQRLESSHWTTTFRAAVNNIREGLASPPELVLVGDRDSDFFLLYAEAQRLDAGFTLRIAQINRCVDPEESDGFHHLNEALEAAEVRIQVAVRVPAAPGRKERVARLEVRTATVALRPPEGLRATENPVEVNVLLVRELNAPRNVAPLEWWLATSEPIDTTAQVIAVTRQYEARWLIEEMHMGIKTGCALESRQLQSRTGFEKLLVLSTSIASELLRLRHSARTNSARRAAEVLSAEQLTILRALRPKMPADPTVYQALRWIANVGGFLMRKSDGEPGWRTLWKGYQQVLQVELAVKSLTGLG